LSGGSKQLQGLILRRELEIGSELGVFGDDERVRGGLEFAVGLHGDAIITRLDFREGEGAVFRSCGMVYGLRL